MPPKKTLSTKNPKPKQKPQTNQSGGWPFEPEQTKMKQKLEDVYKHYQSVASLELKRRQNEVRKKNIIIQKWMAFSAAYSQFDIARVELINSIAPPAPQVQHPFRYNHRLRKLMPGT
jgi:hypothetical protein